LLHQYGRIIKRETLMRNTGNWLFFTIGVGGPEFEAAADRLASQMSAFNIFSEIRVFKTAEILRLCPRLSEWYSEDELFTSKGFGWYTWKSKISDLVVREKYLGQFDGYFYLDAGCEGFLSVASKIRLESFCRNATKNGSTLFSIPTPEVWHSKKLVLEHLKVSSKDLYTPQFQSGSWFLSDCPDSEFIVKQWEMVMSIGPEFSDESISPNSEYSEFKVHRYDQSAFSLICKSYNLNACEKTPPGSVPSIKYYIRAFSYPFWWARNRTGEKVAPRLLRLLGKLSVGEFRKSKF